MLICYGEDQGAKGSKIMSGSREDAVCMYVHDLECLCVRVHFVVVFWCSLLFVCWDSVKQKSVLL